MKGGRKKRDPSRLFTVHRTSSPEETEKLGERIARNLQPPGVILLRGALGTGKTTIAKGIASGLGLRDRNTVTSPSFTLINIYQGRCPIYHVDLYRLHGERDIYSIGLDEFLGVEGVTIVEWAERLRIPEERAIRIDLEDAGGDRRIIRVFRPRGSSPTAKMSGKEDLLSSSASGVEQHTRRRIRR